MEKNALAERLRALGDASNYAEQGEEFLRSTGSTLEVIEAAPQKPAPWHNATKDRDVLSGIHYACKLSNKHGSYSFDFWGSLADAEMVQLVENAEKTGSDTPRFFKVSDFLKEKTGKPAATGWSHAQRAENTRRVREAVKPNAYAILTSLHDDAGESFEDFCSNYGYDTDSRNAERVYNAVIDQERNMRKLYDRGELEALQEIA